MELCKISSLTLKRFGLRLQLFDGGILAVGGITQPVEAVELCLHLLLQLRHLSEELCFEVVELLFADFRSGRLAIGLV